MQNILQHLYKKNTLQEIEVETLQQLTQQHPYFAIGHYLLAKKLAPVSDQDFKNGFQKALAYFHNPLWLQYQLSVQGETSDINSLNVEDAETAIDSAEAVSDISASSLNLVEGVLLHEETQHTTPEERREAKAETAEQLKTENSHGTVTQSIKEETQTAQQPERFSFQAYHTVDYFASQGIKLSQDVNANDKLGKQLKSFTEWLKTMRRLPESAAEEVLDKINDVDIVQFAADSLEEKEVVTEAMAEVLVKQEKFSKARDVYNKLSLLHPHKNAYFAAKIEDLKQQ